MKKILYIGNRLNSDKATVTSVETLGNLLQEEGYTVVAVSSKNNKFLRLLDMMTTVIKSGKKMDVVLIDTYSTLNFYYAVVIGWLCRRMEIPYIPILHGGNLPQRIAKSKRLSNTLFNNAKINVAPSGYMFHHFKKAGYDNVVLIPNTLSMDKYPFFVRKPLEAQLLWVRSFAKIYNPMMALKVIEKLVEIYPDATLCMVGPDKDGTMHMCKNYTEEKNLPVRFTGKLSKEQWIELSRGYSIFINTTNFDNTPVSVMEAMALGLAVVTTGVGGIPYLLDENEAVIVDANEVEEMVEGICRLLKNPSYAEQKVINSRKKAESFDWKYVKLRWNELLL